MKKIILITLLFITTLAHSKVKNIIFMIGDGMGPQQISMLYLYARHAPNSIYKGKKLAFEELYANGIGNHIPTPYDGLVIDSAASATHMATGKLSRPGMIGVDKDAKAVETIIEKAKKAGLSTGIISDTRLTHATPASYAAHVISRKMEAEIAEGMLVSQPDLMFSGGVKSFIPKNAMNPKSDFSKKWRSKIPSRISFSSKRTDNKDLLSEAVTKGYSLIFDKKSMMNSNSKKILGLFTSDAMPDGIWYSNNLKNSKREIPTLTEMTQKSLDILSKNKKGFFLMVEGGQIDWAGHNNDAGNLLHNMIHFEKTIAMVLDWARNRKDTLVVVTADHETGSFGFSYSKRNDAITVKLGEQNYTQRMNFGPLETLDKLYKQKASYNTILAEFESLPKFKQTPKAFRKLFNEHSEFKMNKREAKQAVKRKKGWPVIADYTEFYTNPGISRGGAIARIMGKQQNIVWGTGSHTTTPIPVFTSGPKDVTQTFFGLYNNTHLYDLSVKALGF